MLPVVSYTLPQEFRKELQDAESKDKKYVKRKTVLKKIVANITMGNDSERSRPPSSSPFLTCPECPRSLAMSYRYWGLPCWRSRRVRPGLPFSSQTRLPDSVPVVYLFLVSYGRSKPDQVPQAVPHFVEVSRFPFPASLLKRLVQDCNDPNPLIRALAIRTMSYIPLPVIIDALLDPLRHCLKDKDPYVRKTAAICVAKLYVQDPKTVERHGFVTMVRDLIADPNPTVVANAVASLTELSERSDSIVLRLNLTVANKLIAALEESSEYSFSSSARRVIAHPLSPKMGSDLHSRLPPLLRASDPARRRTIGRAHRRPPPTRQLRSRPHRDQGPIIRYELYGQQKGHRISVQEDGAPSRYVYCTPHTPL